MKNTGLAIIVFIALLIGVVYWYQGQLAQSPQSAGNRIGIANPASVYCTDNGGQLEITTDASGGQIGVCHLRDGRVCEEWALYRDKTCVNP